MSLPDQAISERFDVLPGMAVDPATRRLRFRALLEDDHPATVMPGAYDALSARLCERAGFEAVYLTGAGLSNTHLALPDVGLIGFAEMLQMATRMVEATTIPVVVDADTGYGGPIMVARAVALFETAGVTAIQLEDQKIPKRCGHFDGKSIVSMEEMQAKIDAAVSARRDPNTVIIARTDSRAVEGFDDAIRRAAGYREAGADVLFVEAPENAQEVAAIPRRLPGVPQLINLVEGGRTPVSTRTELDALGFKLVLHANFLMRAMVGAANDALQMLRDGRGELPTSFLTWEGRQSLVGLGPMDAYVDALREKWNWVDD